MVAIRNTHHLFILLMLVSLIGCGMPDQNISASRCECDSSVNSNLMDTGHWTVRGALIGTRFKSLDELKSVISIEYFNNNADSDSTIHNNSKVCIRHCSNGTEVISVLASGITQGDISNAKYGTLWDRISLLFRSPYVVRNRKDLERVYLLARLRPALFGEGDVAFFNLAETSFHNINTPDLAFANPGDSTEKGYINTFNHITAQALITSCFSEELADFVGDVHERYYHPKLINGKFSEKEVSDLGEGPVDNYVDLVNNAWGQKLGRQLKEKYNINRKTQWTPELLSNYLNDMQQYYSWAFQIGFKPFRPEDEQVIKFSKKLNAVMSGRSFENY